MVENKEEKNQSDLQVYDLSIVRGELLKAGIDEKVLELVGEAGLESRSYKELMFVLGQAGFANDLQKIRQILKKSEVK